MKNNKTTIKQALELFGISRAGLYNHMKKLDIKPQKEGRSVYLLDNQIDDLKAVLLSNLSNLDSEIRQVRQVRHDKIKNEVETVYKKQAEEYKKALEKEQGKNEKLQEKIIDLSQKVGQWEGVARTLKDQNQKLLELQPEESEIVEAEIIEPEPEPEKKAEKRGFFQKLFNLKK